MPKRHAAAVMLDHTHCRAICDEIGERLVQILNRDAMEIPPRLLALLNKLAQLEGEGPVRLAQAPSIAPAMSEMSFSESRKTLESQENLGVA
jgi:hypothetical protein